MDLLIWGLIFIAFVIFGAFRLKRNRDFYRSRKLHHSFGKAIELEHIDDLATHLKNIQCGCGEDYQIADEKVVMENNKRYTIVRLECDNCGDNQEVYFDLSKLY